MDQAFIQRLQDQIAELRQQGLYKAERVITSQQQADIEVGDEHVLNFCANNYLGLANHPDLIQAGKDGLDRYGYGMASVRFICGTQDIHKRLERRLSEFLGTEDAILYAACFDANGGLFEPLLGPEDAIISDELNHASIIDGVRLCKAKRLRYRNNDMADLETKLREADAAGARTRMIATDAVFSMDGHIAQLEAICDLAERHGALVMIDDCHGVGFMGEHGRGTHEHCGVMERVDIITGTLGKALGGATGGYTAGKAEVVDWLRNRSRPYLFSNTLAPSIAAASVRVIEMMDSDKGAELRQRLFENARRFRQGMEELGFDLLPGEHPIIPVMLGDAKLASEMSEKLLAEGIYVIGFSYPVVPQGKARIRTQMSAAHEPEHLDRAIEAFGRVGRELGII